MDEKKVRSYAKESTKSKPSGIRFDIEKLEFIQKREAKLTTKQKVVDFLLNQYWWQWKIPVATAKEAPPLALKNESVKSVQEIKPVVKAPKTVAQYMAWKREIDSDEEYQQLCQDVDANYTLSDKQKVFVKTANPSQL